MLPASVGDVVLPPIAVPGRPCVALETRESSEERRVGVGPANHSYAAGRRTVFVRRSEMRRSVYVEFDLHTGDHLPVLGGLRGADG